MDGKARARIVILGSGLGGVYTALGEMAILHMTIRSASARCVAPLDSGMALL